MIFNGMLYVIAGSLLLLSWLRDKQKTRIALKKAYKSLLKNLSMMLAMMAFTGIGLTIVDADFVSNIFGSQSGLLGISLGLGLGSIAFMPSFVAFPLGASLMNHGAGVAQVAGFVSSLMGVGVISYGAESQFFGKKAALIRNLVALFASIIFVGLMGGLN